MDSSKGLACVLVLAVVVLTWQHHASSMEKTKLAAMADEHGFIPIGTPVGAKSSEVLVMAALNRPHEAAQRADQMARDLSERNIPVRRMASFSIEPSVHSDEEIQQFVDRYNLIMKYNSNPPVVFVGGKIQSRPELGDVVAEYEAINP